MKRFISHLAVFFILVSIPTVSFASINDDDEEDNSIEVIVTDEIYTNENPDNTGRRTAPRPIPITISKSDGVSIPNIDKSEVVCCEIYDIDGNCIASYFNDKDFADHLFSISGIVQIRIILNERHLTGWVNI